MLTNHDPVDPGTNNVYVYDTECYPNYWLLHVQRVYKADNASYNTVTFEIRGETTHIATFGKSQAENTKRVINKLFSNNTLVGFNSLNYDNPMIMAYLGGFTCSQLHTLSCDIIENRKRSWETIERHMLTWPGSVGTECKFIDLIEPAPAVMVGLKKYGCRMHSRTIQDLPYDPHEPLSHNPMAAVSAYCLNDLELTRDLYIATLPRLDLRRAIGKTIDSNVMSKSDAQIAESIFKHKLKKTNKSRKITDTLGYTPPAYLSFSGIGDTSKTITDTMSRLSREEFTLHPTTGKIQLPKWLAPVRVGYMTYKMGVGGLHSTEKARSIVRDPDYVLRDCDVTSYYPSIILSQELSPAHLDSDDFQKAYRGIFDDRIAAKHRAQEIRDEITESGNTSALIAELREVSTIEGGYKISLNGSFGKFGSIYSFLYAPELLLAVTLTGQLSLLMLIHNLEREGIRVISANTDGVVCYFHKSLDKKYHEVCNQWCVDTAFNLEYTDYDKVFSRDVNNYLALTTSGSLKRKGVFAPTSLMKDPAAEIVQDAAIEFLVHGRSYTDLINSCDDIRKFVVSRNATGGATWRGMAIGKTLRWIYSTDGDPLYNAVSGNKVALSDGCRPCMEFHPSYSVPTHVDRYKYVSMVEKLIQSVGIDI